MVLEFGEGQEQSCLRSGIMAKLPRLLQVPPILRGVAVLHMRIRQYRESRQSCVGIPVLVGASGNWRETCDGVLVSPLVNVGLTPQDLGPRLRYIGRLGEPDRGFGARGITSKGFARGEFAGDLLKRVEVRL